MLKDAQGLDVTTSSLGAIAAINRWIDQSLSYGSRAETEALDAIAADPGCAIAHAYAAAYYLSQENAVDRQRALPYVFTAQRYAAQATTREQWYIAAIAAWSQRAVSHAITLHEAIATQFPTDLISVQQGQYHYFYRGQHEHLLQIAERVLPANPQRPYLLGMVAFGLEQCHRLGAAETMAHRAIAIHRQDPWAHHALAHVMETQQRPTDGIAWMERHADTWEHCNSMLYTHNWWHVALYYLAMGDTATVLQLYDQRVWGRARHDSPKDQVGAIATLLRLELHGAKVGHRWQAIAHQLQSRIGEHFLPFQDLHYVYALARAERSQGLTAMLQSMTAHAQMLEPAQQVAWTTIAIPAAYGLIAHAQRDYSATLEHLSPVLEQLWKLGGSHAQRLLFSQIQRDAGLHLQHRRTVQPTETAQSTLSSVDCSQLFGLARKVG